MTWLSQLLCFNCYQQYSLVKRAPIAFGRWCLLPKNERTTYIIVHWNFDCALMWSTTVFLKMFTENNKATLFIDGLYRSCGVYICAYIHTLSACMETPPIILIDCVIITNSWHFWKYIININICTYVFQKTNKIERNVPRLKNGINRFYVFLAKYVCYKKKSHPKSVELLNL